MKEPRIKYREYETINRVYRPCSNNAYNEGSVTKYGKYTASFDIFTNRHVIYDEETKTTYKLEWAERHAFSADHEEFGSIQDWYDSLNPEIQARIIKIPLEDKMKEEKEGSLQQ